MDVRKLAIVLCILVLTLTGVALVYRWDLPSGGVSERASSVAAELDARHGATWRACGVKSLGVDPRTHDVVVVFAKTEPGRKGVGRVPALASSEGCGELDMGIDATEPLSVWGETGGKEFMGRVDCVVDSVIARIPEMRDGF